MVFSNIEIRMIRSKSTEPGEVGRERSEFGSIYVQMLNVFV